MVNKFLTNHSWCKQRACDEHMSIHYTVLAISLMKAIKGLLLLLFHLSHLSVGQRDQVWDLFSTLCYCLDITISSTTLTSHGKMQAIFSVPKSAQSYLHVYMFTTKNVKPLVTFRISHIVIIPSIFCSQRLVWISMGSILSVHWYTALHIQCANMCSSILCWKALFVDIYRKLYMQQTWHMFLYPPWKR